MDDIGMHIAMHVGMRASLDLWANLAMLAASCCCASFHPGSRLALLLSISRNPALCKYTPRCMHVRAHTCTHTNTHAHTHAHAHAHTHTHTRDRRRRDGWGGKVVVNRWTRRERPPDVGVCPVNCRVCVRVGVHMTHAIHHTHMIHVIHHTIRVTHHTQRTRGTPPPIQDPYPAA